MTVALLGPLGARSRFFCFLGPQGSGKTLMCVAFCYDKGIKLGRKVISNMPMNFPYTHFNLEWLKENYANDDMWRNSVIYLDEPHKFFNARRSQSHLNVMCTDLLDAIRKWNADFLYSTQSFGKLDIWLREANEWKGLCNYYAESPCKKCGGYGVIEKDICPRCKGFKDPETKECACGEGTVLLCRVKGGKRDKLFFRAWGPNYFGLYDIEKRAAAPASLLRFDTEEVGA